MTSNSHPAWRATVLTLFPEAFPGPLGHSLAGRALATGSWLLETVDIRDFARDKHATVDDAPFGGGPGMVMRPDVVDAALAAAEAGGANGPAIYLSPRGRLLDQGRVRELSEGSGVTLVCGRFEGVDERVIEARGLEEVSLGDFVLSGGELAAMTLLDACVRLLPGVVGAAESLGGREFRAGIVGISPLHPAAGMARSARSRGIAVGTSRTDPRLAPGPSGGNHPASGGPTSGRTMPGAGK